MLIDGEKYACEACVRGHRVSNCHHSDRPLQHIAKKGRPVSQCTHCRSLRKSRSTHVKCDCGGETKHTKSTCKHPKDGEATTSDGCCCSHGGRCACSLKKEPLDPVPESDSDDASSGLSSIIQSRPRAHTAQSEGTGLTVFTNGHHKPAQKHNQMAHKCGLPYVVPRAHSLHGPAPGSLANRSVDNLPHVSTIDALHSSSVIKDSIFSAQQEQRMIKSEHNSPNLPSSKNSTLEQQTGQLTPLDLGGLDRFPEYGIPMCYDSFPNFVDVEQPIFSAGLTADSVDWSHYDGLDFNNDANFATSEFSQAPSYSGFDFCNIDQPALTATSTSGEISEVEDFAGFGDLKRSTRPDLIQNYGSDTSDANDGYRLSTASSFMGLPQTQMLGNSDIGAIDIDDFLRGVTSNNGYLPANASGMPVSTNFVDTSKFVATTSPFEDNSFQMPPLEDDEGLWMNSFTGNNVLPLNNNVNSGYSDLEHHNIWSQ